MKASTPDGTLNPKGVRMIDLPVVECKTLDTSLHFKFNTDEVLLALRDKGDQLWLFSVPLDEWEKHHYPWGKSAFMKSRIGRIALWLWGRIGKL